MLLSFTISQGLFKFMSMESVILSNHLIFYHPLLLPSIFPSIRVFSSESALCIRWPKYWSFSFSPSNQYWPCLALHNQATPFPFFLSFRALPILRLFLFLMHHCPEQCIHLGTLPDLGPCIQRNRLWTFYWCICGQHRHASHRSLWAKDGGGQLTVTPGPWSMKAAFGNTAKWRRNYLRMCLVYRGTK